MHRRYSEREYGDYGVSYEDDSGASHTGKNSLWMIIYTDMITTLMIFFLLSYCLTWLSKEERDLAAESFQKSFGRKSAAAGTLMPEEPAPETKVETALKKNFTNLEVNEERIKITLPSPVLFDSARADLKPGALGALHEIAESIKGMTNKISIEGHTDDMPLRGSRTIPPRGGMESSPAQRGGRYQSNWELSTARAFSVIRYFIEKEGIEPDRLSALGYGEGRPRALNDCEENRAANRRIEISIIKSK